MLARHLSTRQFEKPPGKAYHMGSVGLPRKQAVLMTLRRLLPRGVGPHRIRRGPLRGSVICASWRDYPRAILGRAEPELVTWFQAKVKPGETWLDIGAHYGYTALALSRLVGKRGRVFAFEPILRTAGHLSRTRSANGLDQLVVVPLALGEEPELTVVRDVCCFRGMAQMTAAAEHGELVLSIALDHLWPRLCGADTRVSGIKVDVQGMEISVVRGMTEILRNHRPKLVVEYHGQADLDAFLLAISEAGYDPVARPLEPASTAGGGALFQHARNYEFRPATQADVTSDPAR